MDKVICNWLKALCGSAQYMKGENLKTVWAEFLTLSNDLFVDCMVTA
jgi:hypothetical protein